MSGLIRPKQATLAVGIGALALAACSTPDLSTNLRPEGPPEVLAVMVQVDELSEFEGLQQETATFCKSDDDKVPQEIGQPDFSIVTVCPPPDSGEAVAPVTNANPTTWYVRLVFDELLDPDFETLTDSATGGPCTDDSETCDGHIAGSHPVDLECEGQAVDYDGYYSPNGNALSWPPGPSIVVIPNDFIATSSECTITLVDSVLEDKDGTVVPAGQLGPFDFAVQSFLVVDTDPHETDPVTEVPPDYELSVFFNAPIDDTSFDAGDLTLHDDTDDVDVAFTVAADATDDTILVVTPTAELVDTHEYTFTVAEGAEFADVEGGPLTTAAEIVVPFIVTAAP